MEEKEFIALLEETVEVELGTIALTDQLEAYDWDSLSILGFISAIDTKLNLVLDASKLADAATPADLLALVNDAARR
jgi:acyl carrier protein